MTELKNRSSFVVTELVFAARGGPCGLGEGAPVPTPPDTILLVEAPSSVGTYERITAVRADARILSRDMVFPRFKYVPVG
jgi:hypothetical protein